MMHTRPAEFFHPRDDRPPRFSPVRTIQRFVKYAKYGAAGAIGSMALVHTVGQAASLNVTDATDLASAIVGACVMLAVAKGVKIL